MKFFKKTFFLLLFFLFSVPAVFAGTVSIIDKLGRKVTIHVPVKRAILIVGYEFIPALNIWNQVVGVSQWAEKDDIYKAFIASNKKLRKVNVGSGINLNIETIIKLNPDLIVTWSYNPSIITFLEKNGLKVIGIYPDSLKELNSVIKTFGMIFKKEKKAENTIQEMNKIFSLIRKKVANISQKNRKKVLYVGSNPNIVFCKIGITNDLIKLINAVNPAGSINQRFRRITLEEIIEWNPDIIFIWGYANYNSTWFYKHSQWKYINAVKNKQIYKLPPWSTWSPRVALVALYMAMKTYPKYFKDINFDQITDKFYYKVFGIHYFQIKSHE